MPTRHRRPIRLRFAVPIAVMAFAASACSSASTVATVNGTPIDEESVVSMRVAYEDAATADAEVFRDDLSGLIIEEAMRQAALDEFGLAISDADVEERGANPPPRYAAMFDQMTADESIGEGMVRANALRSLVRDGVLARLVIDGYGSAERLLAESPQDVVAVCARHILVASEDEAEEVLERLEGGERFANLVTELSMDTGSPGGLLAGPDGCPLHLNPLGPEFANVAATTMEGEVGGPIATEFGFHIITVDERVAPTAEQLESDFAAYYDPNAGSDFFSEWFNGAVRNADIEVASRIGTWSPTAPGIVPPASPAVPAAPGGVGTDLDGGSIPLPDEVPPDTIP